MNHISADQSTVVAAALWIQDLLLSSVAVVIAITAVAMTGAAMVTGRIDARRGLAVVLGCFMLFGAPSIANGLRSVLDGNGDRGGPEIAPLPPTAPSAPAPGNPFDPYSGRMPAQR